MNLLLIFDKERNRHAGSSTVSLRQKAHTLQVRAHLLIIAMRINKAKMGIAQIWKCRRVPSCVESWARPV